MKIQINHLLPVALMLLLGGTTFWLQYAIESPTQTISEKASHDPDASGKKVTIARLDLRGIAQYHLTAEHMVHYPDDDSMELTEPKFNKKDDNTEFTVTASRGVVNQEIKEARFYDNVELVRWPLVVDRAAKSSPRCLQQPARDSCDGGLNVDRAAKSSPRCLQQPAQESCDGGLNVDRAAKSSPRCLQQPAQDLCDSDLPGKDALRISTQYMQVFMERGIAQTDQAVTIVNGPSILSGTGMVYERDTDRLSLMSGVKGSFHVQKH